MELLIFLSLSAIIIASIVWYIAKVFISENIEEYNKLNHLIDFKHLRDLKAHDKPHISKKAHEHHRNVKIAVVVIVTAILVLITQNVS